MAQVRSTNQGGPKHSLGHASGNRNRTIAIVVAVVAIIAIAFFVFSCGKTGNVRQGEEIDVVIPAGATTDEIAGILVDDGVIGSANSFVNRVKELDQASKLQSGTYVLVGGDDIDNIINIIATGQTGRQVVFQEGLTIKQIAQKLEEKCGIKADEFISLAHSASDYADEYPFLADVYDNSMEGFLYPDTYRIATNASADEVIRMMLDQFAVQIQTVNMEYAESKNLTLFDVVTMASMVEKEFSLEEDKPLIAAVFYNRLHENMTLGSDVTTYYAVGKDMTEELTVSDLASDSPYNTRNPNNFGLPAGPICNPSVSTIQAAANPSDVDYLYFFFSNKEGKTMYFHDIEDFDQAWAQYGD